MFADDTYITVPGRSNSDIEPKLKSDLKAIEKWLEINKLSCNTSKTSYMTVGSRQNITHESLYETYRKENYYKIAGCTD